MIRGMGVDDVSGKSKAELAKALAHTDTIRAAYLADHGKTLEPVKKTKVWDRYGMIPSSPSWTRRALSGWRK